MKIAEELKEEVKKLSNTQAITFIYSLLRRQKNMFGGLENAQYVFDEITKKFRGEEIDDKKLMESINRFYMESIFVSEESEGAMGNVCFFLENANAFYNQLGNTDDIDYAFAQMNFDMLEGILCEESGIVYIYIVVVSEYIALLYYAVGVVYVVLYIVAARCKVAYRELVDVGTVAVRSEQVVECLVVHTLCCSHVET